MEISQKGEEAIVVDRVARANLGDRTLFVMRGQNVKGEVRMLQYLTPPFEKQLSQIEEVLMLAHSGDRLTVKFESYNEPADPADPRLYTRMSIANVSFTAPGSRLKDGQSGPGKRPKP